MNEGQRADYSKKVFRQTGMILLVLSFLMLASLVALGFLMLKQIEPLQFGIEGTDTIINGNVRTLSQVQRELLRLELLLVADQNDLEKLSLQVAFVSQRMTESSLDSQSATLGSEDLLSEVRDLASQWETEVLPLINEIMASPEDDSRIRAEAIALIVELERNFNNLVSEGEINRRIQAGSVNDAMQAFLSTSLLFLNILAIVSAIFVGFIGLIFFSYKRFDNYREQATNRFRDLAKELKKLSQVASSTHNLVIITDPQGQVEWVNDAFVEQTGYTLAEVLGKTPGSVLQGNETEQETVQLMRKHIDRKEGFTTEVLNYRKSGEAYWIAIETQPSYDDDGNLVNFIAIETDITQRRENEMRLRQYAEDMASANHLLSIQQTRLKSLLQLATSSSSTAEQLNLIVQEGAKNLDMQVGIISQIKNNRFMIQHVYAPGLPFEVGMSCELDATVCSATINSKGIYALEKMNAETLAKTCFDNFFPSAYIGTPIWLNGKIFGTLSFFATKASHFSEAEYAFVDLMAQWVSINLERQQARDELSIYAQSLEKSNRELQDFAYIASHDLQEPLRKIQAFGSRVSDKYQDVLDERGRLYVDQMRDAASRMQQLIEDLLSYSRINTKGSEFRKCDLNKVLSDVLSDLEIRVEQSEAIVETCDLPIIEADIVQMRQLFQNLISNALKFKRPDIPTRVTIHCKQFSSEAGPMLEIALSDNGIGFDEIYAERIFGIFQRLHGKQEYEGTGVGLAICRKIVEKHQGVIVAKGVPNVGASFIFSLPISQKMEN
jgi:PAS domain S-box-containing protein